MNSYKERVRQRIHRLQPADIHDLRKFQRNLLGNQNAIQAQKKHHQWLFDRTPFNNGSLPQLWIFRDREGDIQGQQAGVPYTLHAGHKSWRASWGIDLMLSPEYQLRGVGAVLNSEFVQTNEVSTAAGITEAAQKTLHRAGWMDLGAIPLYARPLSTEGIRAGFPCSNVKGYLATLFGWPLLRFLEGCWLLSVYRKDIRLESIDKFDNRVDIIWENTKNNYPLLARRDLKNLRWRFDAAPEPERYHKYYLYQGDKPKGYAVICYGKRGDRPAAILTDFLCPPKLQNALFTLCITACRINGASDLHCAILSPHVTAADMKKFGFIPLPIRSRFMVFADRDKGAPHELLANPENWFITMADSDMEWMYFQE